MAVTINGSTNQVDLGSNGTIANLAEGGLTDAKIVNADIKDDTISEAKLDIHAAPSGTDKYLAYTANGMEWATVSSGGAALANDANNRVTTADGSGGINGEANLTFDGNNLTLGDGNVIFASGHGLDFAATANAPENSPTTNSELFHDYEEGTWTPFLAGVSSAGSGTYADTWGSYTRIGRVVFASFRLFQSAHTGSGGMRLDGLPFTAVTASGTATSTSNGNHTVGSIDGESLSLTKNKISAQLENANTRFRIMQSDGDMAWVNIEDGQVWLNGTIWYETN